MAGARTGPLYGPLPEIEAAWVTYEEDNQTVALTGKDYRELLRELLELPINNRDLHRLSQAMNAAAKISEDGVRAVMVDVLKIVELKAKLEGYKQADVSDPTALPLIQADVVKYSEEPLKAGRNPLAIATQPLREEIARLEVKICLALDLATWGLEAVCNCSNPSAPSVIRHQAGWINLTRS